MPALPANSGTVPVTVGETIMFGDCGCNQGPAPTTGMAIPMPLGLKTALACVPFYGGGTSFEEIIAAPTQLHNGDGYFSPPQYGDGARSAGITFDGKKTAGKRVTKVHLTASNLFTLDDGHSPTVPADDLDVTVTLTEIWKPYFDFKAGKLVPHYEQQVKVDPPDGFGAGGFWCCPNGPYGYLPPPTPVGGVATAPTKPADLLLTVPEFIFPAPAAGAVLDGWGNWSAFQDNNGGLQGSVDVEDGSVTITYTPKWSYGGNGAGGTEGAPVLAQAPVQGTYPITVTVTCELSDFVTLDAVDTLAQALLARVNFADQTQFYYDFNRPRVIVLWDPISGSSGAGHAYGVYRVERADQVAGAPGVFAAIGGSFPNTGNHGYIIGGAIDTTVTAGKTYYYRVRGQLSDGTWSDYSAVVQVAVPLFPPALSSSGTPPLPDPDPNGHWQPYNDYNHPDYSQAVPGNVTATAIFDFYSADPNYPGQVVDTAQIYFRNGLGSTSVAWPQYQVNLGHTPLLVLPVVAGGMVATGSVALSNYSAGFNFGGGWNVFLAANRYARSGGDLDSVVLAAALGDAGDCLFYGKSAGFLQGLHPVTTDPVVPAQFFFGQRQLDGSVQANTLFSRTWSPDGYAGPWQDISGAVAPLTFESAVQATYGFGWEFADEREFNPGDVPSPGAMFYARLAYSGGGGDLVHHPLFVESISYDDHGRFGLSGLVPGNSYYFVPAGNDRSCINGTTVLTAAGEFIAEGDSVILTGITDRPCQATVYSLPPTDPGVIRMPVIPKKSYSLAAGVNEVSWSVDSFVTTEAFPGVIPDTNPQRELVVKGNPGTFLTGIIAEI